MEKEVKFVLTAEDLASPVIDRFWKQVQGMQKDVNVGLNVQTNATSSSSSPSSSSSTTSTTGDLTDLNASITESRKTLDEFSYTLTQLIDKLSTGGSSGGSKLPSGVNKTDVAGDFTTVDVAKRFKALNPGKKSEGTDGDSQISEMGKMLSTENGNMLRALGQYRIAWLSSMPKSSPAMGAAAGVVIVGAILDVGKKIVDQLAQASPVLRAEFKVLRVAFDQLLRPIGDMLGAVLRPISRMLLQSNADVLKALSAAGYKPGTKEYVDAYYSATLEELSSVVLNHKLLTQEDLKNKISEHKEYEELRNAFPDYVYEHKGDTGDTPEKWLKKWFGTDDPRTPESEAGIIPRAFGYGDKTGLESSLISIVSNLATFDTVLAGILQPAQDITTTISNLNTSLTGIVGPINGLSSLISNIPGVKIATALTGGGGSSTTNNNWSGGINIVVKGAKDAARSTVDEVGNWMRGWTQ